VYLAKFDNIKKIGKWKNIKYPFILRAIATIFGNLKKKGFGKIIFFFKLREFVTEIYFFKRFLAKWRKFTTEKLSSKK
jgi:hypothetical protein